MNNELKDHCLALFFTRGMSLQKWCRNGTLTREVAFYNCLAQHFKKIYFFTYGNKNELNYQKYLKPNIRIISKNSRFSPLIYSLLIPLYRRRILKRCSFFKSNQTDGAWSAYLAKLVNPKAKFVFRSGFPWSLFVRYENKLLYPFVYLLETWLCRASDLALGAYLPEKSRPKMQTIPNWVDTNLFKPQNRKPKAKNRIVFVGRLHKQKNLSSLINALKGTNIALDLIGEGPLKKSLKQTAKKQKVRVDFKGKIEHNKLPQVLDRYPIFVLPSSYEGSPKSLLEAMACGLACVATSVPGSRAIITHGKTGLLAKPEAQSLHKNIIYLINNPRLQKVLGQAARKSVVQNYSLKKTAAKEAKIYAKLI